VNRFDELAADWDDDPAKVARAAAAAAVLRDRIPLAGSGWRALELGSGTGLLSRALAADLGPITLVDTSEQMTVLAAEKVSAVTEAHVTACCLDLTAERPRTAPYDIAYSLLALHHIDDLGLTLEAVHDLLVPGGWIGIIDLDHDPGGSFHRTGHDAAHHGGPHHDEVIDHAHDGFSAETLTRLLRDAGFVAASVTDAGFVIERGEPPRPYPVVCGVARRAD